MVSHLAKYSNACWERGGRGERDHGRDKRKGVQRGRRGDVEMKWEEVS